MTSPHFSDAELRCRCKCGANACTQALVDALEALGPAALAVMVEDGKATGAQKAAGRLPINLNSAYRCPAHNLAVGGEPNSQHMLGLAADIRIQGMTTRQMYRAALRVPAFRGIGVSLGNYIHVDVRKQPTRWTYDLHGKVAPWNKALDEPTVS